MTPPDAPAPELLLLESIRGFWVSAAIHVACALGVPERLSAGAMSIADLAAAAGAHAESLARVLRLLVARGLFREPSPGVFELTALGQCLQPAALGDLAVQQGRSPALHGALMLEVVRTGRPAVELQHGTGYFAHLASRPELGAGFDERMAAASAGAAAVILEHFDFAEETLLVDVGAGAAGVVIPILERHPKLRGVAFDRPATAARAEEAIARAGLARRCVAAGGDFFEAVPPGGSLYLLKHVVHDWDDARAAAILRRVYAAMVEGARILLVENVLTSEESSLLERTYDLEMLFVLGGKERTAAELAQLLVGAGFREVRLQRCPSTFSLIEATK